MYRITFEDLIEFNKAISRNFPEDCQFEVINENNLKSALSVFDSYYSNDEEVACALFRSLITAHGFINGNKRTAFCALYYCLPARCSVNEIEDLAVEISNNTDMPIKKIKDILYPNTKKEESVKDYIGKYIYEGPVYIGDDIVIDEWKAITQAKSEEEAFRNFSYRAKNELSFEQLMQNDPKNVTLDRNCVDQIVGKVEEKYGTDYSDIPLIDKFDFYNKKSNRVPGIVQIDKFIQALNDVGINKFKVRTSKFGTNISHADIKDSHLDIRKSGWSIQKDWDSSLNGFAEVYICKKLIEENYKKMTNKEIREALNKLDMNCIDNDTTFYDLRSLYEAVELKPEERQKVAQALQKGEDAEFIAAYLSKKLDKDIDLGEDLDEGARFMLEVWVPGSPDDDRERTICISDNIYEIINCAYNEDLDRDEAFLLIDMDGEYSDLDQCYDAESLEDQIRNVWFMDIDESLDDNELEADKQLREDIEIPGHSFKIVDKYCDKDQYGTEVEYTDNHGFITNCTIWDDGTVNHIHSDNYDWKDVPSVISFDEFKKVLTNRNSLEEDTVKKNGKWVNKGKEGTHGKFATKKAADAQRKAMFANGYKEELDEALLEPSPEALQAIGKVLTDFNFKTIAQGKTLFNDIHYEIENNEDNFVENEEVDTEGFKQYMRRFSKALQDIEIKYSMPITYSIGLTREGYPKGALDIRKMDDSGNWGKGLQAEVDAGVYDYLDESLIKNIPNIEQFGYDDEEIKTAIKYCEDNNLDYSKMNHFEFETIAIRANNFEETNWRAGITQDDFNRDFEKIVKKYTIKESLTEDVDLNKQLDLYNDFIKYLQKILQR